MRQRLTDPHPVGLKNLDLITPRHNLFILFQKSLYLLYAILNVYIFKWKGEGKG